jgi:poly(A) polymerase
MKLAIRDGRLADLSLLSSPPLRRAFALLDAEGEEARLVGGAVRDVLLGEPAGDFDMATTATPDIVMARAKAAGVAYIPTGVAHGTVTVIVEGKPIEVTTLREDVDTDGRHATVRFGRDFDGDARRRDFTINALSLDRSGAVHDAVGGLADLEAGRVRFIGQARARIREDFLRTLRFLRFSARFGGRLDAQGLAAAIAERAGLSQLSSERVRAEVLKTLLAPHAVGVIAEADGAGLLAPLFGGVLRPARLARLVEIEAAPDAVLRLAALAVVVREDAERLRERLRLSNAEGQRLEQAARAAEAWHGRETPAALGDLRAALFAHGPRAALDAAMLTHAESRAAPDDAGWLSARRFLADTPPPRLPFSGADLMARGVPPGRGMGVALKKLQADWIRAGFPREPDVLARLLAAAIAAD